MANLRDPFSFCAASGCLLALKRKHAPVLFRVWCALCTRPRKRDDVSCLRGTEDSGLGGDHGSLARRSACGSGFLARARLTALGVSAGEVEQRLFEASAVLATRNSHAGG